MFKRSLITATAAIALVIPLAACEDISTDKATASNTPVAENAELTTNVLPKETESFSVDDVFLEVMEEHGLPTDQQSIDAAHSACDALDAGNSMISLLSIAVDELGEDGAYFLGAAVGAYCPEYSDEIDEIAGN